MNKKAFFVTVQNPGVPGAEMILDGSLGIAPEKLIVGSSPACDLAARIPDKHRLLKKTIWGGYRLRIPAGADGSITVRGAALPIKGLLESGLLKRDGDSFLYDLPRDLSCAIDINGSSFVFGLKEIPHVEKATAAHAKMARYLTAPLLNKEDYQFFVILTITAVLNIAMIAYLSTIQIKKKDAREAIRSMPRRFAKLILQPNAAPAKAVARQTVKKAGPKEERPERKNETANEAGRQRVEENASGRQQQTHQGAGRGADHHNASDQGAVGTAGTVMGTDRGAGRGAVASRGLLAVITAKAKPLSFDDNVFKELEFATDNIKRPRTQGSGVSGVSSGGVFENQGSGVNGVSSGGVFEKVEQAGRNIVASAQGSGSRAGAEILSEKKNTVVKSLKKEKKEGAAAVKRDEAGVYKTVMAYSGGLKYIYNNALRKTPTLRGKVTARITISPDGKVKKAEILNSTLNAPDLDGQITSRIYLWKFPDAAGSEDFTIEYTFDFAPVG